MSSAELTHYYQLCTIANGGHPHPAKKLSKESLVEIFGPGVMGVYFLETPAAEFISAEHVIGGGPDPNSSEPILFFGS